MVITGGGTGGHLFPGIAVADELRSMDRDAEIMFIGTERGIESQVIPKSGYTIRYVEAAGFVGMPLHRKLAALLTLPVSVFRARAMLGEAGPDVVVGTGGYVSVAPVLAARLLGIPTVILEQNLVPGLANRMLGKVADAVAVTYHESMAFFPRSKTYLTGNPVRPGIAEGSREEALELFSLEAGRVTVVVLGGSRGASTINTMMLNALNSMLDIREGVQFLHQTGEKDYEHVRDVYRKMRFKAMVVPFIYQMADAYAAADLVVSRAGATTLSELAALGKPSIIIPYPHAEGHQEFNARKLLEAGACRMITERELTAERLSENIRELCLSGELREEMAKNSRALGRPEAARKVIDIAMSLAKSRKGNV